MKKKDIIELIKIYRELIQKQKLLYYKFDIIEDKKYIITMAKDRYRKEYNINENLKYEFLDLKEEIKKAEEFVDRNFEILNNSNCNHPVKIEYPDLFSATYLCPICGNKSKEVDKNKSLIFLGTFEDEDCGIIKNFEINDVQEIILNYLKNKNDNDYIDLNSELKNIQLNGLNINDLRNSKKHRILIICGENYLKINDNIMISSIKKIDYYKIILFLREDCDFYINLIELNNENEESRLNSNSYNTDLQNCKTIDELKNLIENEKNKYYDIIIDISNLTNYKIINSSIIEEDISLDLKKLFPNSYIIKFLSKNLTDEKEIYKNFKKLLLQYDEVYVTQDNEKYTYLENENIKTIDNNKIREKIKYILKSYK